MWRRLIAGLGVVLVAVACDSDADDGGPSGGTASLRLAQVAQGPTSVAIRIDGDLVATADAGTLLTVSNLSAGSHSIGLTPVGSGTPSTRQVTVVDGEVTTLVIRDSSGVVIPDVLADTGKIVPPGASKLRVVHAAALAPPVDIFRSQPDFPTMVSVMFPFAYGAESPYLQSTPGDWQLLVAPDDQPDTLYLSPPIPVADGKRVTVVVMDSSAAGGVTALVIAEN